MRVKTSHIVLGSVAVSLAMSASTFAVSVCRPAETLRTETCTVTSNDYCKAAGYTANGSKGTTTITYGQRVTPGSHNFGDAYICDTNGDGNFDYDSERFYYLANYGSYASLLWSQNSGAGKYSNANVFYPSNASSVLPNATAWSNVALQVNPRSVARINSTETYSYNYTNGSSRLMSLRDLELGLPSGTYTSAANETAGSLDDYAFLFDGMRFAANDNNKKVSYWLEEAVAYGENAGGSTCTNSYSQNCGKSISAQSRKTDHRQWSDGNFVFKPVIEVPFDQIEEDYHEYAISYELDGGSVDGENPTGYKFTDSYTLINPTKQGYVFEGWATNIEGTDAVNPLTIPTGSYGDKKFYAIFSPATDTPYIVKHLRKDINGAYSIEEDEPGTGVTATTIRPTTKTYDGYTSPALQDLYIKADGTAELEYKYEPIEYAISYDLDGGSVAGENPENYYIYNSYTLINPTKQGYVFAGWKINGTGEARMDISVTPGQFGDMLYLATWTPATNTAYIVHHRKQLASGAYDATDADTDELTGTTGTKVTPDRKSYDGYDSPAGVEIEILADGSADLIYYYDLKSYTISIDLAGGSVDGENPMSYRIVDSYSLINPTRAGYNFAGWKVNAGDEVYDNITVSAGHFGDISYTATWEIVDYTISYELDGGTNNANNPVKYTVESNAIALAAPTKTGYVFDGWATSASGENKSTNVTIPTGSTGNKTYYAIWAPSTHTKYTVIHSKQNASGGYSDADKVSEELYGTTGADVYPDVKDYPGYTAPSTRKLTIAADGSASLEYQYTLDSYTIAYTLGDNATVSGNPTSYTVLSGPITLNNPTRAGYSFEGWSLLGRDGMNMTEIIPTGSTGNRDYTANWQLETYQIDYELNGGSVEGENPTTYTVEDEFDLIAPTQNDYTFAGWSLGNDETIVPGKITVGMTGDKTFVAHWDALPGPDDPIVPVNPDDPDVPTDPEVPEDTAGDTPDTRDFVAKNAGVSLVSLFVIVALYWFTRRGRRAN